jgi:hypothetical protein
VADEADKASVEVDFQLAVAIKRSTDAKLSLDNPTKECIECGAPTPSTKHRWCSLECRDIWSKDND